MSGHHLSHQQQQKITYLLKQCRASATPSFQIAPLLELSSEISVDVSFTEALKSLYHSLVEASEHRSNDKEDSNHDDVREDDTIDQFRQKVAEFLIHDMNRIIVSLDEEIEGPFLHNNSLVNSCDLYYRIIKNLSGDVGMDEISISQDEVSEFKEGPERWIDKCLDMCGYSISLEVSVECLRRVVHASNIKSSPITTLMSKTETTEEEEMPNLAAVVTSLRTVRRRLLDVTFPVSEGHLHRVVKAANSIGNTFLHLQKVLGQHENQSTHLFGRIILPFEYYIQSLNRAVASTNEPLLSESLMAVTTSVIPVLVASACHAMKLPLPLWASKESHWNILNSAFGMALVGNIFRQLTLRSNEHSIKVGEYQMASIHAATSEYFESLLKHMILHKNSSATIRLFYQICNPSSDDVEHCNKASWVTDEGSSFDTPQSILCFHFEQVFESIPAKRDAASFIRAMLLYSVSKHRSKLASLSSVPNRKSEQLDTRIVQDYCMQEILPILEFLFVPMLSRDTELREAVVDFVILSSSVSFHPHKSVNSTSSLDITDHLIPRCTAMLLSSACDRVSKVEGSSTTSSDSSTQNTADESSFLSLLRTVTAVWCEEVFVSRTQPQQQQFVTEFILYPLKKQTLSQADIEKVDDAGASLAGMLIQGISSRLEASRAESIRKDGQRVAEAMALVFGQTVRFAELETPDDPIQSTIAVTGAKQTKKKLKRIKHEPKAPLIVDPDAEYFSDDSDSCASNDSSSRSAYDSSDNDSTSDISSWGEDALEPYQMNDDEDDLRRVPLPRSLRDCLSYLLATHDDNEAYDKHRAALQELPALVSSNPLDLVDVVPTLVRVLLAMDDKFNMDGFLENRWDSLVACAAHAPIETCSRLIEDMKGSVSLETRLEALSVLGCSVELLSGVTDTNERMVDTKKSYELSKMSTRLMKLLTLHEQSKDILAQPKTQRWRQPRPSSSIINNNFNAVSAHMILSLFAFLSQTKNDDIIWGGPLGERFLCEFLRTLSVMVNCSKTYPSSRMLAVDLFDLAWSFHDAKSSEVRHAVLIAMATSISVECVVRINDMSGLVQFLSDCSSNDSDANNREIALSVVGAITNNSYEHSMIA